jgi:nucleoside-diphosphate-sugar epimerase
MKVLVTGATGFIGRACVHALRSAAIEHQAWGRDRCDLRDSAAVRAGLLEARPTHVLHLAAAGVVPAEARRPSAATDNVAMAASLLAAAEGMSLSFVVAGTMAEYGALERERIDERAPTVPTNPYGIGKLAASLLFAADPRCCVARLFGVYGPGEQGHRLFPAVLQAARSRRSLPMSDGSQVRDFIHVADVARALISLLHIESAPRVLNVGTGVGLAVRDVAERVMRAAGGDAELLEFGARPRHATDVDRLVADTTLLERTLGHVPQSRFTDEDLDVLVASYRGPS